MRISWLVDPDDRSVIIFGPDSRTNALRDQQQADVGDIIPGFRLVVEEFFAPLELR